MDKLENIDLFLMDGKLLSRVASPDGKSFGTGAGRIIVGGDEVFCTTSYFWTEGAPSWLIPRLKFNGKQAIGFM